MEISAESTFLIFRKSLDFGVRIKRHCFCAFSVIFFFLQTIRKTSSSAQIFTVGATSFVGDPPTPNHGIYTYTPASLPCQTTESDYPAARRQGRVSASKLNAHAAQRCMTDRRVVLSRRKWWICLRQHPTQHGGSHRLRRFQPCGIKHRFPEVVERTCVRNWLMKSKVGVTMWWYMSELGMHYLCEVTWVRYVLSPTCQYLREELAHEE